MEEINEDDIDGVYIHFDDNGLPCFDCFFGSLFHAPGLAPTVMKNAVEPDDEYDQGMEDEIRQFVCTMGYLADKLAALVVNNFGEASDSMLEGFVTRIQQAAVLQQAEESGPSH
jgi:hypothetical protein